jgi:hypothetical protein
MPLAGRFDLRLRAAGATEPLPVGLRESTSGEIATVAMVPSAPLAANMRFEIVYAELDDREPSRVVATFMTGERIDDKPPVWSGVTTVANVGEWPAASSAKPKPPKRGVITLDTDLLCSGPGIAFTGAASATDDDTRSEDLRYAIWIGDPDGPIDYTAPPLAYERGTRALLRPSGSLLSVQFGGRLPPNDFSFPAGKRVAKVGLRAIDLAGNTSAASEHLVHAP